MMPSMEHERGKMMLSHSMDAVNVCSAPRSTENVLYCLTQDFEMFTRTRTVAQFSLMLGRSMVISCLLFAPVTI